MVGFAHTHLLFVLQILINLKRVGVSFNSSLLISYFSLK